MSDDQPMLTEDRRCGRCGEPVTEVVGEVRDVQMEEHGLLTTLSVAYLLKPCGHAYIKAVV